MTENVKLYVYLAQQHSKNPAIHKTVIKFRRDMMHIGRDIHRFVSQHESSFWTTEMEKNFEMEALKIGALLTTRFKHKEMMLYSLYQLSNANQTPAIH